MKQIIEIRIRKLRVNFVATCDLFPSCKGVGRSKELAIKQLSLAISQVVSSLVKDCLDEAFSSKCPTRLLMDHTVDPTEERLAYNLNSRSPVLSQNVMLKMLPFQNKLDDDNDALSVSDILDISQSQDDDDESASWNDGFNLKMISDNESTLFGFPINFN